MFQSIHLFNIFHFYRFLYIPLVESERAWAYAMQLKVESNTEHRKRYHMLNRLRKAVVHAERLNTVCESDKVDACTKLEGQVCGLSFHMFEHIFLISPSIILILTA